MLSYFYLVSVKYKNTMDARTHPTFDSVTIAILIIVTGHKNKSKSSFPTDIVSLTADCHDIKTFMTAISMSKGMISKLELDTRGQSGKIMWQSSRRGRLTASNLYRVYTKVETLKTLPHTDVSVLVNSLLFPDKIDHLPQIIRGKTLEKEAIQAAVLYLSSNHKNIKCWIVILRSSEAILGCIA